MAAPSDWEAIRRLETIYCQDSNRDTQCTTRSGWKWSRNSRIADREMRGAKETQQGELFTLPELLTKLLFFPKEPRRLHDNSSSRPLRVVLYIRAPLLI